MPVLFCSCLKSPLSYCLHMARAGGMSAAVLPPTDATCSVQITITRTEVRTPSYSSSTVNLMVGRILESRELLFSSKCRSSASTCTCRCSPPLVTWEIPSISPLLLFVHTALPGGEFISCAFWGDLLEGT